MSLPHQNSRAGVAMKLALQSVECRRCATCKHIRHITDFNKASARRDGVQTSCKECQRVASAKHHAANVQSRTESHRKWVAANRERDRANQAAYRQRPESKARHAARAAASRRTAHGTLKNRIVARLYAVLRGAKGGQRTEALVGWKIAELRDHLQRQFLLGMSWENMGEWHIDHIVPLSSFTITGPDDPELRRAWALTNLRPLWAKDNIRKGAKQETLL